MHLLKQFLDDASGGAPLPDDHPFRGIHAMPRGETRPEFWMLGSGVHSAVYAAEFGLPFAHAHFISPDGSEEAVAAYRDRFKPSAWCADARGGDGGGGAGGRKRGGGPAALGLAQSVGGAAVHRPADPLPHPGGGAGL